MLFVEHAGVPGGSAVSLRNTARALDRSRFEVLVALTCPSPTMARFHEAEGVEVIPWPGIGRLEQTTSEAARLLDPRTWPSLVESLAGWRGSERRTLELLARFAPDVVHLNSVVLLPSARALRGAGRRFVWHVRESPVEGRPGLLLAYQRRALRKWGAEVIFLSEAERALWGCAGMGTVIPDPVDEAGFSSLPGRSEARRELGIGEEAPVVLYTGGLVELKGVLVLLEALRPLAEELPGLACLMPGWGPVRPGRLVSRLAPALLPFSRSARLARRGEEALGGGQLSAVCRRTPFEKEVGRLFAACDVVVFPALLNHSPRPALEAAAASRPIVASNLPSIAEVVEDGRTGLLVTAGSAEELARGIRVLLSDPARAREMGAAARLRFERDLAPRGAAGRIEERYRRVAAAPPRGPEGTERKVTEPEVTEPKVTKVTKVTIVTVTRDDVGRLSRAVASVGAQSYRNIQYVVVDGGSKDGTPDLLARSSGVVSDWLSEPDEGIYDAMNKGISLAKGDWILFLGSDDALADPDVVSRCVSRLEKAAREEPEPVAVAEPVAVGFGDVVYSDGRRFRSRLGPATLLRNTVHHQGACYAASLFRDFRYDSSLALVADWELNLAVYRRGLRWVALDEVVSVCDAGGESGRIGNRVRTTREFNAIRSRHLPPLASALLGATLWLRTLVRLAISGGGRRAP